MCNSLDLEFLEGLGVRDKEILQRNRDVPQESSHIKLSNEGDTMPHQTIIAKSHEQYNQAIPYLAIHSHHSHARCFIRIRGHTLYQHNLHHISTIHAQHNHQTATTKDMHYAMPNIMRRQHHFPPLPTFAYIICISLPNYVASTFVYPIQFSQHSYEIAVSTQYLITCLFHAITFNTTTFISHFCLCHPHKHADIVHSNHTTNRVNEPLGDASRYPATPRTKTCLNTSRSPYSFALLCHKKKSICSVRVRNKSGQRTPKPL
jgi:hypothetical protein